MSNERFQQPYTPDTQYDRLERVGSEEDYDNDTLTPVAHHTLQQHPNVDYVTFAEEGGRQRFQDPRSTREDKHFSATPDKKYVTNLPVPNETNPTKKTSNKLTKIIDALEEAGIQEAIVGEVDKVYSYIGRSKKSDTLTELSSEEKTKTQLKYNWYYNYFLRYGNNLLKNPNTYAVIALISIALLFVGGPIVAPLFAAIASLSAVAGAFVAIPHVFKSIFNYFEAIAEHTAGENRLQSANIHLFLYPLHWASKHKGQAFIVGLGAAAFIAILVMTALYMASGGVSCEFMGAIIEPLVSVLKNAFELLGNFLGLDIIGNISLPALAAAIVVIAPLTVTATTRLSVDAYEKHITLVDADDVAAEEKAKMQPTHKSKGSAAEVGCCDGFTAWHNQNMEKLSSWHQQNVSDFNEWSAEPGCFSKMFGNSEEEPVYQDEPTSEQTGCLSFLNKSSSQEVG